MKIYAYNNGSKSAKALAEALNTKLLKHEGKPIRFKGPLINWGNSKDILRHVECGGCLNPPNAVRNAVNKLQAFKLMKEGVSIPPWTESLEEAVEWIKQGSDVVVRHKLSGHSAEGLEIITTAEGHGGLTPAPLYTKYIKKDQEYRIHVFRGNVFFVQRKARKKDVPDEQVNWQVRNLKGGFIYANVDVKVSEKVEKEAKAAIMALGLDFGAVDIIETKKGDAYVLEVNTSPGLERSTLEKYAEQFKALQA